VGDASGTVFVVDDDELLREGVAGALRARGYGADVCAGGRAAVETLTADPTRYAVAVLDVNMPDLTGLQVFEQLRAAGVQTPILFMSGERSAVDDAILAAPGVLGFLRKPFGLAELLEVLAPVLDG